MCLNAVVDEYVNLGPRKLTRLDQWYKFNTMLEGEFGVMSFRRIWKQQLQLSGDPTLPGSRRFVNRLQHNYIFSNGVGHLTTKSTRVHPF